MFISDLGNPVMTRMRSRVDSRGHTHTNMHTKIAIEPAGCAVRAQLVKIASETNQIMSLQRIRVQNWCVHII